MQRFSSRKFVCAASLALILCNSGCGSNNPVTPPLGSGVLLATTNDGDFSSQDALADSSNGIYTIHANVSTSNGIFAIEVSLPKETTIPYSVDVATDPIGLISYVNPAFVNPFVARQSFGSGTIQITQVSPTLMGTFRGILWQDPPVGTDTVRGVTNGEFNAPFQ